MIDLRDVKTDKVVEPRFYKRDARTTILIKDVKDIELLASGRYELAIIDIGRNTAKLPPRLKYELLSGTCIIKDARTITVKNTARLISLGNKIVHAEDNAVVFAYNSSECDFSDTSVGYLDEESKGYFRNNSRAFLNNSSGVFKETSECFKAYKSVVTLKGSASGKNIFDSYVFCMDKSKIQSCSRSEVNVVGKMSDAVLNDDNVIYIGNTADDWHPGRDTSVHITGERNRYLISPEVFPKLRIDNTNNIIDTTISRSSITNSIMNKKAGTC